MKENASETQERLLRVRTTRRGAPVEIRVHYEIERTGGCDTYRLVKVEENI